MVFNAERMKASMSEEEFALVIDAILNGKYSWACVLVLKNAGYEPGHYIPYRTLNRLIKENGFPTCHDSNPCQAQPLSPRRAANQRNKRAARKGIRDLNFFELSANESKEIKGGSLATWNVLDNRFRPMEAY